MLCLVRVGLFFSQVRDSSCVPSYLRRQAVEVCEVTCPTDLALVEKQTSRKVKLRRESGISVSQVVPLFTSQEESRLQYIGLNLATDMAWVGSRPEKIGAHVLRGGGSCVSQALWLCQLKKQDSHLCIWFPLTSFKAWWLNVRVGNSSMIVGRIFSRPWK